MVTKPNNADRDAASTDTGILKHLPERGGQAYDRIRLGKVRKFRK